MKYVKKFEEFINEAKMVYKYTLNDFKIGQTWKTRKGDIVTIVNIGDSTYPIEASNGQDYTEHGFKHEQRTSTYDLIELVEDISDTLYRSKEFESNISSTWASPEIMRNDLVKFIKNKNILNKSDFKKYIKAIKDVIGNY